jgi:hypothetical protein
MSSTDSPATTAPIALTRKAIVKPAFAGSPLARTCVAMMVPATCAPTAEPMLRTTVLTPVASPVWRSATAPTMRLGVAAKAAPTPALAQIPILHRRDRLFFPWALDVRDKVSVWAHEREAGGERLATDGVVDDVGAVHLRPGAHLLADVLSPIVDAQLRSRRDHTRSRQPCDLDRHVSDTTRTGLHQHKLAAADAGAKTELASSLAVIVTSGAAAASTKESRFGMRARNAS